MVTHSKRIAWRSVAACRSGSSVVPKATRLTTTPARAGTVSSRSRNAFSPGRAAITSLTFSPSGSVASAYGLVIAACSVHGVSAVRPPITRSRSPRSSAMISVSSPPIVHSISAGRIAANSRTRTTSAPPGSAVS